MAAQDQEQVQPAYKETHMTVSDMSSQDQTPGSGLQGLVLDRLEKVDRSPEEWREPDVWGPCSPNRHAAKVIHFTVFKVCC